MKQRPWHGMPAICQPEVTAGVALDEPFDDHGDPAARMPVRSVRVAQLASRGLRDIGTQALRSLTTTRHLDD